MKLLKQKKSDKLEDIINIISKNVVNFNIKILDVEYKTNYLNSKKMEIKREEKIIFLKTQPIKLYRIFINYIRF